MPVLSYRLSSVPNPTPPFPEGLGVNGPRMSVQLEVSTALAKYLGAQNKPVPPPVAGQALIDTGATASAIDKAAVAKLGLKPIGLITLGTAGGPSRQPLYPLKVVLIPVGMAFEFESVTGCDLTGTGLLMLIGRDVLSRGLLVYEGTSGSYTFAV